MGARKPEILLTRGTVTISAIRVMGDMNLWCSTKRFALILILKRRSKTSEETPQWPKDPSGCSSVV